MVTNLAQQNRRVNLRVNNFPTKYVCVSTLNNLLGDKPVQVRSVSGEELSFTTTLSGQSSNLLLVEARYGNASFNNSHRSRVEPGEACIM
jgi:hypothetical protein